MGQQQARPTVQGLWLVGGQVFVEFTNSPARHRVCRIESGNTWAIVDGAKIDFDLPPGVDLFKFFIITRLKEDKNGQAQGKKRGVDEWKPVKLREKNIPYVEDNGERLNVINETNRPWTTKEKVALGFGVGAGVLATSVAAVVAAPFAIAAAGFTAAGITAGSTAAAMMSAGVVGVATLQSIGAAGMGIASILVVGGTTAAVGGSAAGLGLAVANNAKNVILTEDGQEIEYIPLYSRSETKK